MRSRAKSHSSQGLLLVEAVLSAVVVAVALAFISRGLTSQLQTLSRIESYHTVLGLADGKLMELEGVLLPSSLPMTFTGGTFADPYQQYRWRLARDPRTDLVDEAGVSLVSDVTILVEHVDVPSKSIRLGAIWPGEWVP